MVVNHGGHSQTPYPRLLVVARQAMTAPPLDTPPGASAPRIAWFSPMPPSSSGIAAYSAEVLPYLRARGARPSTSTPTPLQSPDPADGVAGAHDFVWRHRRAARTTSSSTSSATPAATTTCGATCSATRGWSSCTTPRCTRRGPRPCWSAGVPRRDDYLAEFAANHPDAPPDLGLLVAEGLGGTLFGHWPHVRLVLQAARLSVVHSPAPGRAPAARSTRRPVRAVPMGVADPLATPATDRRRGGPRPVRPGRARIWWSARSAGVTPEKRLPQVLDAVTSLAARSPRPAPAAGRHAGARTTTSGRRRRRAWHRRPRALHRASCPTRSWPRTCRPPTSAPACAGRPTARPRRRGCARDRRRPRHRHHRPRASAGDVPVVRSARMAHGHRGRIPWRWPCRSSTRRQGCVRRSIS